MTEKKLQEQKELTTKIQELHGQLSKGGIQRSAAEAEEELAKKREIEGLTSKYEKEYKNVNKKIETLEKQLSLAQTTSGGNTKEISDLKQSLQESLAQNEDL